MKSWNTRVRLATIGLGMTAALVVGAPAHAYPPGKAPIVATAPKSCSVKKSCIFVFKRVKPGTTVTVIVGKVKASAKANGAGTVTVKLVLKSKAGKSAWSSSKIEGKIFKGSLAVK